MLCRPSPSDPHSSTLSRSLQKWSWQFIDFSLSLSLLLHGGIKRSLSLSLFLVIIDASLSLSSSSIYSLSSLGIFATPPWPPECSGASYREDNGRHGSMSGSNQLLICWLFISADRWLSCHPDHYRLALSPLLASLQHTPPQPPEHSWSPWWECKGKCRSNELLIAAYFFFNPILTNVDCHVTPNSGHLHSWYAITVTNYFEPVGTPIDGDHMKGWVWLVGSQHDIYISWGYESGRHGDGAVGAEMKS